MSDEDAPVQPITRTRQVVTTVEAWPQRTAFLREHLEARQRHVHYLDVNADVVTVKAHNGTARYRLRPDLPAATGQVVADLIEGDTPGRLRQRGQKYVLAEDDAS